MFPGPRPPITLVVRAVGDSGRVDPPALGSLPVALALQEVTGTLRKTEKLTLSPVFPDKGA